MISLYMYINIYDINHEYYRLHSQIYFHTHTQCHDHPKYINKVLLLATWGFERSNFLRSEESTEFHTVLNKVVIITLNRYRGAALNVDSTFPPNNVESTL